MARVRGVTAASIRSGSMLAVAGSGSTGTTGRRPADREPRGDVGVGRDDHLVAGPHPHRHEREVQGVEPDPDAHAVPRADVPAEASSKASTSGPST